MLFKIYIKRLYNTVVLQIYLKMFKVLHKYKACNDSKKHWIENFIYNKKSKQKFIHYKTIIFLFSRFFNRCSFLIVACQKLFYMFYKIKKSPKKLKHYLKYFYLFIPLRKWKILFDLFFFDNLKYKAFVSLYRVIYQSKSTILKFNFYLFSFIVFINKKN